jgi:hypothetical protein
MTNVADSFPLVQREATRFVWIDRTGALWYTSLEHCTLRSSSKDGTARWNTPETALAGGLLMVAPAVEGIDLIKKGHVVITAEQFTPTTCWS